MDRLPNLIALGTSTVAGLAAHPRARRNVES